MIIPNPKIYLACSNDDFRPALCGVFYDGKGGLWATDGHIICSEKVELEKGDITKPRIISADAFKFFISLKGSKSFIVGDHRVIIRHFVDPPLKSNDRLPVLHSISKFQYINEEYPELDRVMPGEKDLITYTASFSVEVFNKLIKAMNVKSPYSGVVLTFRGTDKIIQVEYASKGHKDTVGGHLNFLMPIRLQEFK